MFKIVLSDSAFQKLIVRFRKHLKWLQFDYPQKRKSTALCKYIQVYDLKPKKNEFSPLWVFKMTVWHYRHRFHIYVHTWICVNLHFSFKIDQEDFILNWYSVFAQDSVFVFFFFQSGIWIWYSLRIRYPKVMDSDRNRTLFHNAMNTYAPHGGRFFSIFLIFSKNVLSYFLCCAK